MNLPPPTVVLLALAGLACVLTTCAGAQTRPASRMKIVGYYPEWAPGSRGYHVHDVRAERLTHVIYAFARVTDGEIAIHDDVAATQRTDHDDTTDKSEPPPPFRGNFRQLVLLKRKHPHLRTLISIGGWGGSGGFSDAALTDASRAKFARSCAAFVARYDFDGVDVDWEFPVHGGKDPGSGRPEDKRNFTLLLQSLRAALDKQGETEGRRYLLTFAAPAGAQNYAHLELDQVHLHVDWINLMTYDYAGAWSKTTGFNAPLFEPAPGRPCVDATVRAYLAAGVPPEKIVLGVPFYGVAFDGVPDDNQGLFRPHNGKPPKLEGGSGWTWRELSRRLADNPSHRHWHDAAKAPWLFDPAGRLFVTYDDAESLRVKADYGREHNLGGVMIWELSQDDERATLLKALHTARGSR